MWRAHSPVHRHYCIPIHPTQLLSSHNPPIETFLLMSHVCMSCHSPHAHLRALGHQDLASDFVSRHIKHGLMMVCFLSHVVTLTWMCKRQCARTACISPLAAFLVAAHGRREGDAYGCAGLQSPLPAVIPDLFLSGGPASLDSPQLHGEVCTSSQTHRHTMALLRDPPLKTLTSLN